MKNKDLNRPVKTKRRGGRPSKKRWDNEIKPYIRNTGRGVVNTLTNEALKRDK